MNESGSIGEWKGEEWLYFHFAADMIRKKLGRSSSASEAQLRKLCAVGEIRAIVSECADQPKEEPEYIPPSRWRDEEVDHKIPSNYVVAVSGSDLRHWLNRKGFEALKSGPGFRGDSKGPWEFEFYGERWLEFERAAIELGDKFAIPHSAAQAKLHKLCASGEIRAVGTYLDREEMPEPIPPSEWPEDDLPRQEVWVSNIDFYNWLDRQAPQPTAGGKQSRIIRLLAELFPTGVPNRADYPREPLKAALLERDPSLKPLDLKTLKAAIDVYNRVVGNARNTSVSD